MMRLQLVAERRQRCERARLEAQWGVGGYVRYPPRRFYARLTRFLPTPLPRTSVGARTSVYVRTRSVLLGEESECHRRLWTCRVEFAGTSAPVAANTAENESYRGESESKMLEWGSLPRCSKNRGIEPQF